MLSFFYSREDFCKTCFFSTSTGLSQYLILVLVLKHYHHAVIIFLLFLDLSFMHKDFNIHTLQKSLSYWTIKRANKTDIPEGNVFSRLKTLLDSFSENNYSAIFHYYHNTKNWFLQLYLLQRFTGPYCTTSFFDKTILAKMF